MKSTMWRSHLLSSHLSYDYSIQLPVLRPLFTIPQQVHIFCLNQGKTKAKQPCLPHLNQLWGKGDDDSRHFFCNTQPLHYFAMHLGSNTYLLSRSHSLWMLSCTHTVSHFGISEIPWMCNICSVGLMLPKWGLENINGLCPTAIAAVPWCGFAKCDRDFKWETQKKKLIMQTTEMAEDSFL